MFDWLRRKCPLRGAVYFRGDIPPTAENFERLSASGITVTTEPPISGERWRLALDHDTWGKAVLICPQDAIPIPDGIIEWCWLSDAEKAEAQLGKTMVYAEAEAPGENILRERKHLLRFLHAVSGRDGVAAADMTSELLWSRANLEEELSHDADLDVESLYAVHAVTSGHDGASDGADEIAWIHTHGLAALGLVDFSLVQPRPGAFYQWHSEATRAIAGLILEENLTLDSGPVEIGTPNGVAELVDIKSFVRNAKGYAGDLLRNMIEDDDNDADFNNSHLEQHAVVCEPSSNNALRHLFSGKHPRPVRFLWEEAEIGMMFITTSMTSVMAARARATYDALRAMADEFRSFEFPILVKLGYEVDHGEPDEREHLWFQVHDFDEDTIDATLVNEPFDIAAMQEGDRARYPVAKITDWLIMTPFGNINPHSFTTARMLREDPETARALMQEGEAHGS